MGYIGINNIARKIKSVYIGVNDKARKVLSGYVGVNNTARLWWETVQYPVLKRGNTWDKYKSKYVEFMDSYTPTGEEEDSWIADTRDEGTIMGYKIGNKTIIAGNGTGRIAIGNADSMFYRNTTSLAIEGITGLSVLDTSNVYDMSNMFRNAHKLKELDVSSFDTRNVTSMASMFRSCGAAVIDVSGFDTSNVTTMYEMFRDCSATELDVSGFNTGNVTSMGSMFSGCMELTSLDISHFDMSNVVVISAMFDTCSKLTSLKLPSYNIPQYSDFHALFKNCKMAELDLRGFYNFANVNNMNEMFMYCSNLTRILVNNTWTTATATGSTGYGANYLFTGCGCSNVTVV